MLKWLNFACATGKLPVRILLKRSPSPPEKVTLESPAALIKCVVTDRKTYCFRDTAYAVLNSITRLPIKTQGRRTYSGKLKA